MRGHLSKSKWTVESDGTPQNYYATRTEQKKSGQRQTVLVEIHAHCLACAKYEVLTKYGGEVDLRGWHKQGSCGLFLTASAEELKEPPEEE